MNDIAECQSCEIRYICFVYTYSQYIASYHITNNKVVFWETAGSQPCFLNEAGRMTRHRQPSPQRVGDCVTSLHCCCWRSAIHISVSTQAYQNTLS